MKTYLLDVLGMEQVPMTKGELRSRNGQFVEKYRSELLSTPLVVLPADRVLTSQEMTEMMHRQTRRFKEAMSISLEQTGFVFTKYCKTLMAGERQIANVEVILEESMNRFEVLAQSHAVTDEDAVLVRHFIDDIVLHHGITEEDIYSKSQDYQSYVAAMADRLRENREP